MSLLKLPPLKSRPSLRENQFRTWSTRKKSACSWIWDSQKMWQRKPYSWFRALVSNERWSG